VAEVTEQAVRSSAERVLGEKLHVVEVVARNSNLVFGLVTVSAECFSLRVPRLHPSGLPPLSPCMPDISGNQFVYRDGALAGWSTSTPTSYAHANWSCRRSSCA
jgi:hypothetical protein